MLNLERNRAPREVKPQPEARYDAVGESTAPRSVKFVNGVAHLEAGQSISLGRIEGQRVNFRNA